jgi:hypothetical protein
MTGALDTVEFPGIQMQHFTGDIPFAADDRFVWLKGFQAGEAEGCEHSADSRNTAARHLGDPAHGQALC